MTGFGTKAQTLVWLRPLVKRSEVLDLIYFEVSDWNTDRDKIVDQIKTKFLGKSLIVRSSALSEDRSEHSMAGKFDSQLDVNSGDDHSIVTAVDSVIDSYQGNPHDQILIQPMLDYIAVSGVITTHVLDDGAPYYVINYDDESGKTDTITGGTGVNKTVLIHHNTRLSMIESERVALWLELAKELEPICDNYPLDIEFAQTHDGQLYLLQVRKITVVKNWNRLVCKRISEAQQHIENFIIDRSKPRPHLLGDYTILGEMPDWNPAEIIGTSPRPLAVSLYRYLITDETWRLARAKMGYRNPINENLMVIIGGRPFIDVRNSFNSFISADLDNGVAGKVVNAALDRLNTHPELHDKVEFDVLHTALDFSFKESFESRFPNLLTGDEFEVFAQSLRQLTSSCLDLSTQGTLSNALNDIAQLEKRQKQRQLISFKKAGSDVLTEVLDLLVECRQYGTLPFSIIARHAFIAETLLRSAVQREAIASDRIELFKQSLVTVMGHMAQDFQRVIDGSLSQKQFLQSYGHLRPGTYDILSLRYDQREDLFVAANVPESLERHRTFEWTDTERRNLETLIKELGFTGVDPEKLLIYCRRSIVGREHAKFVFSRNLSDALELIAMWGEQIGLSRVDMSYIALSDFVETLHRPVLINQTDHYGNLSESGRKAMEMTRSLRLTYLIRNVHDTYVLPMHRSAPNFVTQQYVERPPIFINSRMETYPDLYDKIVCIENADPGFDWIFTRGIAGLVTQFGGANSHMAIRCAEMGIPAAIGCGEHTFSRLFEASMVELNCADKVVRPVYG